MSWIRIVPGVIEIVIGVMEKADEKREEHHKRAAERQERHNERQAEIERRGLAFLTPFYDPSDETKRYREANIADKKIRCQKYCEPILTGLLKQLSEKDSETFAGVYPAFAETYTANAIENGDVDGAYAAAIGSAAMLVSALQTADADRVPTAEE